MSDTLLLNATGAPVSFLPLSTITWQDAIKYMVLDKATVLAWHDNWIVRSARWETAVPSIVILKEYMKPKIAIRFSKSNVFLRDNYHCAYCACGPCNASKGNNKKIVPKFKPHKPSFYELVNKRKAMPFQVRHSEWLEYLR